MQRLDGHIDSDFIPILETISDCACDIRYPNGNSLDFMLFHSSSQRLG